MWEYFFMTYFNHPILKNPPKKALLMIYFRTVTKLFSLKYVWGKKKKKNKSPRRRGVILAAAVSQNNLLILNLFNRGGAAQRRHKRPATGCSRVSEKMVVRYLKCNHQSLIQAFFILARSTRVEPHFQRHRVKTKQRKGSKTRRYVTKKREFNWL